MNCLRRTARTGIEGGAGLWMRRTAGVSFLIVILLAPAQSSAQALQSFEDLALRINLGDQLQIEDPLGLKTRGRLIHLTRDEIVIKTDAAEKRFASDAVREVAVSGHSLREGALMGIAVLAVLGGVATCLHEGGGACIIVGPLRAAPVGAGAGLAIGALISRTRTVYRALENRVAVPGRPAGGGAEAGLLEDLALRVNLGDQLRVEDRSGNRTTGRLTRLTADEITIGTNAGEKPFRRETIRQVALQRQPLRMAVLIGAGAGAATGAVAACTGPKREECADAPILAGAFGAGLGLAAGALMHRTTVVYPETAKRTLVSILPAFSRNVVGVAVSLYW